SVGAWVRQCVRASECPRALTNLRTHAPCKPAGSRYYSGVRILRTTISCVAVAIFGLVYRDHGAAEGLFFPLVESWTTTLESPPAFKAAFDDTHAYIARRDNQLDALSLQTGKLDWSVECPMKAPPVAGGRLVFSGGDRTVEARSQRDGTVLWRAPV